MATPIQGLLGDFSQLEQLAQMQAEQNRQLAEQQAALNRVNQVGPYGSVTYEQGPGGQWSQVTQLSPAQQQALAQQQAFQQQQGQLAQGLLSQFGQATASPFSMEGLPPAAVADAQERQRIEDALYSRQSRWMDEQWGRDREAQMQNLADRGIPINSEAWQRAMTDFDKRRADAYADARAQAIGMGGQEMERSFGLGSQARQQALAERQLQRGTPMAELQGLLGIGGLGGAGGVQTPQAMAPGQVQIQPGLNIGQTALGLGELAQKGQISEAQLAMQEKLKMNELHNALNIAQQKNLSDWNIASGGWGAQERIAEANRLADWQRAQLQANTARATAGSSAAASKYGQLSPEQQIQLQESKNLTALASAALAGGGSLQDYDWGSALAGSAGGAIAGGLAQGAMSNKNG